MTDDLKINLRYDRNVPKPEGPMYIPLIFAGQNGWIINGDFWEGLCDAAMECGDAMEKNQATSWRVWRLDVVDGVPEYPQDVTENAAAWLREEYRTNGWRIPDWME